MNTEAEGEEKLPFKPRLKRLARRTVIDWNERSVATYASSIAFFFSISIIPMIIILLQFLPYAGLSQLELLSFIEQLIPETVYWLAVRVIAEAYNRSVTVLSASAVILIWSASRGTMALRWGLNRVYGVKERRRYPVLCLLAIGSSRRIYRRSSRIPSRSDCGRRSSSICSWWSSSRWSIHSYPRGQERSTDSCRERSSSLFCGRSSPALSRSISGDTTRIPCSTGAWGRSPSSFSGCTAVSISSSSGHMSTGSSGYGGNA